MHADTMFLLPFCGGRAYIIVLRIAAYYFHLDIVWRRIVILIVGRSVVQDSQAKVISGLEVKMWRCLYECQCQVLGEIKQIYTCWPFLLREVRCEYLLQTTVLPPI